MRRIGTSTAQVLCQHQCEADPPAMHNPCMCCCCVVFAGAALATDLTTSSSTAASMHWQVAHPMLQLKHTTLDFQTYAASLPALLTQKPPQAAGCRYCCLIWPSSETDLNNTSHTNLLLPCLLAALIYAGPVYPCAPQNRQHSLLDLCLLDCLSCTASCGMLCHCRVLQQDRQPHNFPPSLSHQCHSQSAHQPGVSHTSCFASLMFCCCLQAAPSNWQLHLLQVLLPTAVLLTLLDSCSAVAFSPAGRSLKTGSFTFSMS
jgi:hypothetical protein